MTDNAFDLVRKVRHLPGLTLTATLDPTKVTKRVKTAAQKMLRSGIITSGYRSKARMLAEQLLDDADRKAPVVAVTWGAFIMDVSLLTQEAREKIIELVEAAKLIEHANHDGRRDYINQNYAGMVEKFSRTRFGRFAFHTHQLEINMQIAEVVAACRTPLMREIHNELADKLDSTEPFHINF